jgi:hypothetical protein
MLKLNEDVTTSHPYVRPKPPMKEFGVVKI